MRGSEGVGCVSRVFLQVVSHSVTRLGLTDVALPPLLLRTMTQAGRLIDPFLLVSRTQRGGNKLAKEARPQHKAGRRRTTLVSVSPDGWLTQRALVGVRFGCVFHSHFAHARVEGRETTPTRWFRKRWCAATEKEEKKSTQGNADTD